MVAPEENGENDQIASSSHPIRQAAALHPPHRQIQANRLDVFYVAKKLDVKVNDFIIVDRDGNSNLGGI